MKAAFCLRRGLGALTEDLDGVVALASLCPIDNEDKFLVMEHPLREPCACIGVALSAEALRGRVLSVRWWTADQEEQLPGLPLEVEDDLAIAGRAEDVGALGRRVGHG